MAQVTFSLVVLGSTVLCQAARAGEYDPRPTVLEELKDVKLELRPEYARDHPRLEFGPVDKAGLRAKAEAHPKLWQAVVKWADELKKDAVTAKDIRNGSGYHFRPNRVFAAALVGYVNDDAAYKKLATDWTIQYCKEDLWGSGYQANVDMAATWYSYYLALVYDLLHGDFTEGERTTIRDGLAEHGRAIYKSQVPIPHDAEGPDVQKMIRWEQGHMYMPLIGLGAIAFALSGEVPEADDWSRLVYAKMRRTFWVHPEDGYHFEGAAYWDYAIHWPLRYGFLLERATGERLYDIPHFRYAALFARHIRLPGPPHVFDIADCGGVNNWPGGKVGRRMDITPTYARYILRGVARAFKDGAAQALADEIAGKYSYNLDPAIEFLWYDPKVTPSDLAAQPPYHHFQDHDVVFWRSSWRDDATCYAFRCGPPEGHKATGKLNRLKDWTMNCGHTHADVGSFLMFARGRYLAVDTGYLCNKTAVAHNTLLVDGQGQWNDGSYWVYRGTPYEKFDPIRIEKVHLEDKYGYVCGDMSAAYPDSLGKLSIKRHLVMTHDWLLVVDDIDAESEHTYTWLVHADGPILEETAEGVSVLRAGSWQQQGQDYTWQPGDVRLVVKPLGREKLLSRVEPTIVSGGGSPGRGVEQQRGYQLELTTEKPARKHRFVVLLTPDEALSDMELTGSDERHVALLTRSRSKLINLKLDWGPPKEDADREGPLSIGEINIP